MDTVNEKELDLMDYIRPVVKHRRFILWFWFSAVILAVIVSFLLPKIYTATTTIMPPNPGGDTAGLLSNFGVSGNMGSLAAMMLGIPSSADLYIDILKSQTIADAIIDRFNLMEIYKKKYRVDTIKALANHTDITKTKGEMVTITIEDKDPKRAADIANAYVEKLDMLTRQLGMTSASRMRVFLEKRIFETKKDLQTAEENLKNFQITNKMVALDEQTKALVTGAAELEGQLIAAETELGILRSFSTEDNIRVKLAKTKISELKKQLVQLEGSIPYPSAGKEQSQVTRAPSSAKERGNSFHIPLSQVPDLGMELIRLLREVKIQETVFELLTQQYELTRINEAKDTQTIQIVDTAKPPDKKTKPKRTLIVLITAFLAFVFGIFVVYCREYFQNLSSESKIKYQNIGG
jgi:uncharacterized protein involved in exopolysaccharide biosynthesis